MSAVQAIHTKILSSMSSLLPQRSPSGQLLLAESRGRILGGVQLCIEEEHPDLVGRVCVVSHLSASTEEPLCFELLLRAMSFGVAQGARWLVLVGEEEGALFRGLGFRALQAGASRRWVFYLKDFSESWLASRG